MEPSPHAQDPHWADLGEATRPPNERIGIVSLLKRVSAVPHEYHLVRSLNADQPVVLEFEDDPMAQVADPNAFTPHGGGLADCGVPIHSNTQSKGPDKDGDDDDDEQQQQDDDDDEEEPEEDSGYEPDTLPGIEEWDL